MKRLPSPHMHVPRPDAPEQGIALRPSAPLTYTPAPNHPGRAAPQSALQPSSPVTLGMRRSIFTAPHTEPAPTLALSLENRTLSEITAWLNGLPGAATPGHPERIVARVLSCQLVHERLEDDGTRYDALALVELRS